MPHKPDEEPKSWEDYDVGDKVEVRYCLRNEVKTIPGKLHRIFTNHPKGLRWVVEHKDGQFLVNPANPKGPTVE